MLKFYYNPKYKYTNRYIVDVSGDTDYQEKDYINIDSPDTINGHIIYTLSTGETFSNLPTYIVDTVSGWKWFVSGITQLNSRKFQISLLRDIISESPNTWKNERAYISSGTAQNYNRYKKWNLPFTNTKIKEEKLTINGKSSFFVYYVNEQHFSSSGALSEDDLKINAVSLPGYTNFDYTVSNLNQIPSYQYINAGNLRNYTRTLYDVKLNLATSAPQQNSGTWTWESFNNIWQYDSLFDDFTLRSGYSYYDLNALQLAVMQFDFANNVNSCKTNLNNACKLFAENWQTSISGVNMITNTAINNLSQYVGKTIYDSNTNKVYRLDLEKTNSSLNKLFSLTELSTLTNTLSNINWPWASGQMSSAVAFQTGTGGYLTLKSQYSTYKYVLTELGTATSFDFTFISNTKKLPKSSVRCVNIVSNSNISDEEIAQCLMLAQTNATNVEDVGRILDIQYLPFSIATTVNNNIKINSTALTAQFLETDDFQYDINLTDLTNINKETDTIKIVSPSRASQYVFSPYNNNGNMEFAAKITVKPYASIIYIRPSTKGLLMYEWDDKDCLIIEEDFSLTNVTSQWTQYIYNNKNYSNVFERQIQGREYERGWERKVEEANLKSEEWNARNISAQKARTYTGNLPLISDIAGAIGTAWADANYMKAVQTDLQYNEALYQEGLSLSRDLFTYQLDNIKSQPLIPSKITTIDCKFLDGIYLEFYSTNSTELQSIENFYLYNGNRIDDYGTFAMYWGNFVRGKIIISLNYTQPEIDELNRRLGMGIFTGGIL